MKDYYNRLAPRADLERLSKLVNERPQADHGEVFNELYDVIRLLEFDQVEAYISKEELYNILVYLEDLVIQSISFYRDTETMNLPFLIEGEK